MKTQTYLLTSIAAAAIITAVAATVSQSKNTNSPTTGLSNSRTTALTNFTPLTAAPIKGEKMLRRTGYTCSYNPQMRQPNYVAWTLTKQRTYGQNRREPQFYEDTQIAADSRARLSDYYNSGMSRGHMCPAADNKWNAQAMRESFLLSNICPQTYTLNGEDWEQLESFCRNYVRRHRATLHIICGPVFTSQPPIRRYRRLFVPDKFFKAIVCLDNGAERGIAFLYNNDSEQHSMRYYVRTIDQIEELTGYDLFASLPANQQQRLEAQANLEDWQ